MKTLTAILAVACATLSLQAAAEFAKPEDAIAYRQAALKDIASRFTSLQPVIRGQEPYDAVQFKASVDILKTLAAKPWSGFGPGTEGGKARPEVWSDAAGFKQKEQNFLDAVGNLSAAADGGDLAKVRAAFGAVGASCKACHDAYRN